MELFKDRFASLVYGEKYEILQDLKRQLSAEEFDLYCQQYRDQKRLMNLTHEFGEKAKRLCITSEDFEKHKIHQEELRVINKDSREKRHIWSLVSLDFEIEETCNYATRIRDFYSLFYSPSNRTILYTDNITRPYLSASVEFPHVKDILLADGGIIVESYEQPHQDRVFSGVRICDGEGESTPSHSASLLHHARNTEGFAVWFLSLHGLINECRTDWELTEAREIQGKKNNIFIFNSTNQRECIERFL